MKLRYVSYILHALYRPSSDVKPGVKPVLLLFHIWYKHDKKYLKEKISIIF